MEVTIFDPDTVLFRNLEVFRLLVGFVPVEHGLVINSISLDYWKKVMNHSLVREFMHQGGEQV